MDLSKPVLNLVFGSTNPSSEWQERMRHRLYEAGKEDEELSRRDQQRICLRRRGCFEVKSWW